MKEKVLRQLITKDGLKSPIEEIFDNRYEEIRPLTPRLTSTYTAEAITLGEKIICERRYRQKRIVNAVIIEMEEI